MLSNVHNIASLNAWFFGNCTLKRPQIKRTPKFEIKPSEIRSWYVNYMRLLQALKYQDVVLHLNTKTKISSPSLLLRHCTETDTWLFRNYCSTEVTKTETQLTISDAYLKAKQRTQTFCEPRNSISYQVAEVFVRQISRNL